MTLSSSPKLSVNKWQAVVFDLDDTLYPESEYVLSGFRAVADWTEKELGVARLDAYRELHQLYADGVRGDTFNQWLARHGFNPGLITTLVDVYRAHTPILNPFPEVSGLLGLLRKSYRIGLLSDGYLDVQKRKFAALGLEAFFEVVIFSDQWGRQHWKPHVRPFQAAAELFRLHPSKMVYVADNPAKDFVAPRQLGMSSIRFQRSHGEYAGLMPASPEYAPDYTISSFSELESLLAVTEKSE